MPGNAVRLALWIEGQWTLPPAETVHWVHSLLPSTWPDTSCKLGLDAETLALHIVHHILPFVAGETDSWKSLEGTLGVRFSVSDVPQHLADVVVPHMQKGYPHWRYAVLLKVAGRAGPCGRTWQLWWYRQLKAKMGPGVLRWETTVQLVSSVPAVAALV